MQTYNEYFENKKKVDDELETFNELYTKLNESEQPNIDWEAFDKRVAEELKTKSIDEVMEELQNEGFLGSIVGGVAGATIGPAVMRAVCQALGITNGILYNLFTSRLVTTGVGVALGARA